MFYHVWTLLLIYHDVSNNVVQVCSLIKLSLKMYIFTTLEFSTPNFNFNPWTALSVATCTNDHVNNHVQAGQLNHIQAGQFNHVQSCQQAKTSCAFLRVYKNDLFLNFKTFKRAKKGHWLTIDTVVGVIIDGFCEVYQPLSWIWPEGDVPLSDWICFHFQFNVHLTSYLMSLQL